jgi:hypothetical protein
MEQKAKTVYDLMDLAKDLMKKDPAMCAQLGFPGTTIN